MNERIQELAYDAEDYADTMVDGGSEFHPVFVGKFAELIVRECAAWIDKQPGWDGPYGHELIKYFGIDTSC